MKEVLELIANLLNKYHIEYISKPNTFYFQNKPFSK